MAKKGTKATRKFAASGQLTKKIQARRKHQQIQRKVNKNKNGRSKGPEHPHVDANGDGNEEESAKEIKSSKKRYVILYHSVDDTLRLHITPVL
jgi:nucleolar complex protein 2